MNIQLNVQATGLAAHAFSAPRIAHSVATGVRFSAHV